MTFSCISSEYMRESHDLHTHMKQSAVIDRLQIWIGKGDQLLEYGSSLPWVASVISHTCLSSICIFYLYNYVLGLNLMLLINCSCWVQIWSCSLVFKFFFFLVFVADCAPSYIVVQIWSFIFFKDPRVSFVLAFNFADLGGEVVSSAKRRCCLVITCAPKLDI